MLPLTLKVQYSILIKDITRQHHSLQSHTEPFREVISHVHTHNAYHRKCVFVCVMWLRVDLQPPDFTLLVWAQELIITDLWVKLWPLTHTHHTPYLPGQRQQLPSMSVEKIPGMTSPWWDSHPSLPWWHTGSATYATILFFNTQLYIFFIIVVTTIDTISWEVEPMILTHSKLPLYIMPQPQPHQEAVVASTCRQE